MRKIDKSKILSTVYKNWEKDLESNNQNHPNYDSNARFYKDVVMNLYHAQGGLCAYTEMKLMGEKEHTHENLWKSGRYEQSLPKHLGDVEHFDESLKANKGWLWDNLFMVLGKVNNLKGTKLVSDILKPDHENYNPDELLDYDFDKHIFFANAKNPDLNQEQLNEINRMIDVLGLNFVKDWRKNYLSARIKALEFGLEPDPVEEYMTAFEMTRRNLGL
jgi:hypothetical protein